MQQVAAAIVWLLLFALVWLFGSGLPSTLAAKLPTGWQWLALPMTAVLRFGGFMVLRPFILDQPRTPIWFVLALVAVALLVSVATAAAEALLALARTVFATVRGSR